MKNGKHKGEDHPNTPTWARPDVKDWLDGKPMSMEVWKGLRGVVLATPAFKKHYAVTKDSGLMDEMTLWLAEMLQYFYKSAPEDIELYMLQRTSRFIRDGFRYLFVYQLKQAGFAYVCPKTKPHLATPARCVYSHGYTTTKLMRRLTQFDDKWLQRLVELSQAEWLARAVETREGTIAGTTLLPTQMGMGIASLADTQEASRGINSHLIETAYVVAA